MSIEIIHQIALHGRSNYAALFCNTTMIAFGPIFYDHRGIEAEGIALAFLIWGDGPNAIDIRTLTQQKLSELHCKFHARYLDTDDPQTWPTLQRFIWENTALSDYEDECPDFERCDVCSGIFPSDEIGDDCSCDECRATPAK